MHLFAVFSLDPSAGLLVGAKIIAKKQTQTNAIYCLPESSYEIKQS